jgi:hypothetical protein
MSADVDALLAQIAHPLTDAVAHIRAQLLAVPGVVETVKWKAPNYALDDDFATFSLRRPTAVRLILHTGAKPKPDHPEIETGPLPRNARRADRNRIVLTYTGSALSPEETEDLRRLLSSWVAQLE